MRLRVEEEGGLKTEGRTRFRCLTLFQELLKK